ncbi:MAG: gamma-glutamylcyclotransferase [Anaerolineae bacterium]
MDGRSKQSQRRRPFFVYGTLLYRRVIREIRLTNGRSTAVWVYVGQSDLVTGRSPIPGGDWAAYVTSNQHHSPPT